MSKEPVLPRQKVTCQADNCVRDTIEIKHEERALVGLKRNGDHVHKAFMHEKCYNMHSAKPLRDKYDEASTFELREVRYEINPGRQGFSSDKDIMGEIQEQAEDVADAIMEGDIYWLDQDIKLFIDDFLSKHGIYVHPKVINDVALGLCENRQKMLIGEVSGDTSTDTFKFECLEDIKKFDFVMVVTDDIQACDTVLAQVDEVTKRKDGSMVAEANVIGYRNEKGMLKKLRATISPGSNVYKASQEIISDYLDLNDEGLNLGVMENDDALDVLLNPDDLLQHIAVIAKTGYGKSFSTGVIIEEMLSKNMPVVVIDPHGEYHTMAERNPNLGEDDQELYGIEPEGFSVKTYTEDPRLNDGEKLKLDGRNLEYDSLKGHFGDLTTAQSRELRTALRSLQDRDEDYDIVDIIDYIEQQEEPNYILIDKLELVEDLGIYTSDEDEMIKPEDLVEGGQLTIINLKGTDPELQKTIAHLISRELFEEKKYGDLPPFVEIIEEAHNFIPGGKGSSQCAETLSKIASEGRKFGMGLGVISQRPAKIDSDVLSQCKMQIILRVTNPQDLKSISKSFENVTPQVQNHITGLAQGNAIVLGNEYPLMTEVRNRKSKHGGTGHSFEDK
jgi:DNA helicase HerA-like ATPase